MFAASQCSVNAALDFLGTLFFFGVVTFAITGWPFIGLIYIDVKANAMSLPDRFIENPNKCSF